MHSTVVAVYCDAIYCHAVYCVVSIGDSTRYLQCLCFGLVFKGVTKNLDNGWTRTYYKIFYGI